MTATDSDGVDYVHLPLFVLRKAPQELLDFDLTDGRKTALSLPTRQSNAELSKHALRARAGTVMGHPLQDPKVNDLIDDIAYLDPDASLYAAEKLIDASTVPEPALAEDDDFRFLTKLIAWSSIVSMPVPVKSGEQIYKLTYSEPINEWKRGWKLPIQAGLDPLNATVEIPFTGAQSFHLEVHPPDGMSTEEGAIAVSTPNGYTFNSAPGSGRAMHLYVPDAERGRSGAAVINLRAQRRGLMSTASFACAAVAAVLVGSTAFAGHLASANTVVPSLLLFLPALLATLALQPTSHALSGRLLRVVRGAIGVSAVLAYLAAFWLLVAPTDVIPHRSVTVAESTTPKIGAERLNSVGPKTKKKRPRQDREAAQDAGKPANESEGKTQLRLTERSTKPDVGWLRVGWSILAVAALAAFALVETARRRAMT